VESTERAPNKRLKLAGGDRFKGSGVLCPGAHAPSFNDTAHGGRVARSLRAIGRRPASTCFQAPRLRK